MHGYELAGAGQPAIAKVPGRLRGQNRKEPMATDTSSPNERTYARTHARTLRLTSQQVEFCPLSFMLYWPSQCKRERGVLFYTY